MLEILMLVGCFSMFARFHANQRTIDSICARTIGIQRELRS